MKGISMKLLVNFKILSCILLIIAISCQQEKTPNTVTGRIESVQRKDLIKRVTVAGNIESHKMTIVTAPYNGYIKELFVQVGQNVKKGDPLVSVSQTLDSSDPVYPLRASFNGVVVTIQKQEGEFVKQDDSESFILRLDNMDQLYVSGVVPELDVLNMTVGQKAIVKISSIIDKTYDGVIEEISLASSFKRNSWQNTSKVEFPIRIKIVNKDEMLRPGMSAIVDIITLKKDQVLCLPHEFVLKEKNQFYVFLDSGVKKEIVVGVQNESFFEILSGMEEGQKVRQIDFMNLLPN